MPADCTSARRWLSAFRDGDAVHDASARTHVDTCPACRSWEQTLDRVTRRVAVRGVATPDLVGPALLAWHQQTGPAPTVEHRVGRLVLAVAGGAGLALAALSLTSVGGVHVVRDVAAFEAALSVGFLVAAWRPDVYARGLRPVAAAAAFLVLLPTAADLGRSTSVSAEASHLAVLIGLIGLFLLADAARHTGRHRAAPRGPRAA